MASTYVFDIAGYSLQRCTLKNAEELLKEVQLTKHDHELSLCKDDLYINLVISFDKRKAYLIFRDYQNSQ